MAKYSVILPVRNGGTYVQECIQSILHQTLPDFNLLVLDNCSSDGTLEYVRSLHDEKIEIYPAENPLSIEENWGRIKSIKKNKFMTLIGHDDILHTDYLMEIDSLITKHPDASLYHTHFKYIDGNGNFVRSCLPMCEMQRANEFIGCQMNRTIDSTGTGYVMRSDDFDLLGGMPTHYPNLIFSDYELWVKLMLRGYKATSFEESFSYRLHQSVSKTTNGMMYQQAFGFYMEFLQRMMKDNILIKEAVSRYGREMLLYFCKSLSHRLLKTPSAQRTLRVGDFIKKCEAYAKEMIPGQEFNPMDKFQIRIAKQLDSSFLGRGLFNLYKRLQ
jgi:glycosyltransferase involved in cell wall biosynthesis